MTFQVEPYVKVPPITTLTLLADQIRYVAPMMLSHNSTIRYVHPCVEPEDYVVRGDYPSLTILDLAGGIRKDDWGVDLFIKNATDEDAYWYDTAQCSFGTCGPQRYIVRERPISFAVKFSKDFDF